MKTWGRKVAFDQWEALEETKRHRSASDWIVLPTGLADETRRGEWARRRDGR